MGRWTVISFGVSGIRPIQLGISAMGMLEARQKLELSMHFIFPESNTLHWTVGSCF